MKISNLAVICSLVASTLLLPGCNEFEQAAVTGGLIGAAIGVAVSNPPPERPHHCRGGYRTRCTEYRDYYGYWHRECRETYSSCSYYDQIDNVVGILNPSPEAPASTEPALPKVDDTIGSIAEGLSLSFESATKLDQGVAALQAGNPKGFEPMGLSLSELVKMRSTGALEEPSLQALSQSLNLDPQSTKVLVEKIIANIKTSQVETQP